MYGTPDEEEDVENDGKIEQEPQTSLNEAPRQGETKSWSGIDASTTEKPITEQDKRI